MTDIREHPPPATASAAPAARAMAATRPGRVVGLDGIRGLAALFVVLNHIFERAWPGYPANPAPFWAAWMTYGRFAVVMFIALSGFSLGLGPARSGWRFNSIATYAHRRAWRILPPYTGRARIQSGDDLVRARPARLGTAQREVRRRVRLARA